MSYRGDIRLGDTIDFKFTSRRFTTGAPFTLAGSPALAAYPGNSTTEITAGITLTADFDGRTGLNHVRIVATSGNGYATATDYDVVITTGTVDSVSVVGEVVGAFSIEKRSALMPTTAARTLDVSATGEAGIDWANIGAPTTSQTLSGTTVGTVTAVTTVNALATNSVNANALATDAVTEIQSGLATSAAQATLQADTDNIQTRLPAALVSGRMDCSVGAYQTGLTPLQPTVAGRTLDVTATGAAGVDWGNVENPTTSVGLTNTTLSTSQIVASVTGAVGSVGTNGITAASLDATAGAEIADAVWDEAIAGHLTAGSTGEALNASGGGATPAAIADAVWDEAIAGHLTAGSTGSALNASGGAGDPWITTLPGAYTAGQAGFIVGTNLNATVSSRATQASVDNVQADTDNIQTRLPAALVGGKIDASIGALGADSITASTLSTDAVTEIANGLRDLVIEGGVTFQQSMRLHNAANGGKLSGAASTTVLVRDLADSKNRINATVDANGNRAAVTLDLT